MKDGTKIQCENLKLRKYQKQDLSDNNNDDVNDHNKL